MHTFIDRRQNPKGKSLGNRQRFLRRTRKQLKDAVDQAVRNRSVKDLDTGETVDVDKKSIDEPRFVMDPKTGRRKYVIPGNKDFVPGDRIRRPQGGGGGGGRKASDGGEGEDSFSFALTREEFLDILFEDLELPDLVKTDLTEARTFKLKRAGFATTGTHANLSVPRTMKNAFGRRLALRRPSLREIAALQEEIDALERDEATSPERLEELRQRLSRMETRRRAIAFVDPVDVRYNSFKPEAVPNTKAVMFCLMDVSASMGEFEKDLAKRFFMLLHLFLQRCYEKCEIVFIRHTHFAQEVDEETFFYGRETGGTKVSSALQEMHRVVTARYPSSEWNIYVAQASDGDNLGGDSKLCVDLLDGAVMPLCQYFAYIEIKESDEADATLGITRGGADLWRSYEGVAQEWDNFQMRRVSQARDIYPVFRELFARRTRA